MEPNYFGSKGQHSGVFFQHLSQIFIAVESPRLVNNCVLNEEL